MTTALFDNFLWCALQVTLLAVVGAVLYLLLRRDAILRSALPRWCLMMVVFLSLLVVSPWPSWSWFERSLSDESQGTQTVFLDAIPELDSQQLCYFTATIPWCIGSLGNCVGSKKFQPTGAPSKCLATAKVISPHWRNWRSKPQKIVDPITNTLWPPVLRCYSGDFKCYVKTAPKKLLPFLVSNADCCWQVCAPCCLVSRACARMRSHNRSARKQRPQLRRCSCLRHPLLTTTKT